MMEAPPKVIAAARRRRRTAGSSARCTCTISSARASSDGRDAMPTEALRRARRARAPPDLRRRRRADRRPHLRRRRRPRDEGVLTRSTASGMQAARRSAGIAVAWITGSRAPVGRCIARGASASTHVLLGRRRQARGVGARCARSSASPPDACAHIGDDLPDIPVMRALRLRRRPCRTRPHAVRAHAHYVTQREGGARRGARARRADPRRAGHARCRRRRRALPDRIRCRDDRTRSLLDRADRVVAGAAAGRPRGADLLARCAGAAAGAARATAPRGTIPTSSSSASARSSSTPRARAQADAGRQARRALRRRPDDRVRRADARAHRAGQARVHASPPTRGKLSGDREDAYVHAATCAPCATPRPTSAGDGTPAGPVTLTTEYAARRSRQGDRADTDKRGDDRGAAWNNPRRRARARQQGQDAQAQDPACTAPCNRKPCRRKPVRNRTRRDRLLRCARARRASRSRSRASRTPRQADRDEADQLLGRPRRRQLRDARSARSRATS